jgi:hypothetical protein
LSLAEASVYVNLSLGELKVFGFVDLVPKSPVPRDAGSTKDEDNMGTTEI